MSGDVIETMAKALCDADEVHKQYLARGEQYLARGDRPCVRHRRDAEIALSVVRDELADEALREAVRAVSEPWETFIAGDGMRSSGTRTASEIADAALTAVAARFGGAP